MKQQSLPMHTLEELEAMILSWAFDKGILCHSVTGHVVGNSEAQLKGAATEIVEIALAPNQPDEWGDLLVWAINGMAAEGFDMNTCLQAAFDKISQRRDGRTVNGVFIKAADL